MKDEKPFDTPDKILHAALEKERQARDFYEGLLPACSVGFVKELVEKLMNEESKHIRMVEDIIVRLNLGRDIS